MIYSVGVRGRCLPSAFNPGIRENAVNPELRRVAEDTGGGYLAISKDLDLAAAFARVADELHSQYLLGYVPPKSDGKTHSIGVRVNVSGMRARARKNYVAPSAQSK